MILEAHKDGILPTIGECQKKKDLVKGLESDFKDVSLDDMNTVLNRTFKTLFKKIDAQKKRTMFFDNMYSISGHYFILLAITGMSNILVTWAVVLLMSWPYGLKNSFFEKFNKFMHTYFP
eukprot:TRINITY_DN406_c1_g1_i1.p1 TRINITY_DN406_c1_g1~~TRINITY_DN406_c1_g1_i1.p1  ORF type:complete len:120 (+),score=18.42 TRINITY_DN406_c1_g1_i1:170-529(+)